MSKMSEAFFKTMVELLPETKAEYEKHMKEYEKRLDTVVIEDIFMPEVNKLLEEDKNKVLLKKIFDYFEDVSGCGDEYLINIFSITVLEILGNDKEILTRARDYMGKETARLQRKSDGDIGRVWFV